MNVALWIIAGLGCFWTVLGIVALIGTIADIWDHPWRYR